MVGSIYIWTDALLLEQTLGVPLVGEVISDEGLGPIGEYISQHHISVAQYISTRLIFDIAAAEERRLISPLTMRWWEQEVTQLRNDGRGSDESGVEQE